jgi:hypothetical protein
VAFRKDTSERGDVTATQSNYADTPGYCALGNKGQANGNIGKEAATALMDASPVPVLLTATTLTNKHTNSVVLSPRANYTD